MWFIKILLTITILISSCHALPKEVSQLSDQLFKFAQNFTLETMSLSSGNVIVSPLSVATSLALLSQATNGKTLQEIVNGLYLTSEKETLANQFPKYLDALQKSVGNSTLSLANKVYVQKCYQINPNIQKVAEQSFASAFETLNFVQEPEKSAIAINKFVDEKTKNKITELVSADSFDDSTRVVLVNAIHFKGAWQTPFKAENNFKADFYLSISDSVKIDYMTTKNYFYYSPIPELNARLLEMNYANSNYSFVIILPNCIGGLPGLEATLNNYDLGNLIRERIFSEEIEVTIPKFKIEFDIKLNDVLKKMGIVEVFSENADLSGLLEPNLPLYVSDVIHKAVIEVNEEGSEAAAATELKAVLYASFKEPEFRADHPFLYYIREKTTNTILFSGRYLYPSDIKDADVEHRIPLFEDCI